MKLLNDHEVKYLVVGGHAVGVHGYPRNTADLDVWVQSTEDNARRIVQALRRFGFDLPALTPSLFVQPNKIVRMGVPPLRIEVYTGISGVTFDACYPRALAADLDGVPVRVIALDDLRANKKAAGRAKDLADLEGLHE